MSDLNFYWRMDDMISRRAAIDIVYGWFKRIGLNGDICLDGLRQLPPATDKNVGTKLVIDTHKIERAIRGLTEWQKHVQTESDIDRDISVAVEALKAQLGMDLAEVGTDCISRQQAINALSTITLYKGSIPFNTAVMRIEQLPSAQPEIVRCKDCKYCVPGYITDNDDFIPPKCGEWQQMVGHSSDDYCSLEERRED